MMLSLMMCIVDHRLLRVGVGWWVFGHFFPIGEKMGKWIRDRQRVFELANMGYSHSRIQNTTGRSLSFIKKWVRRGRDPNENFQDRLRSGRKKKFDSDDTHKIVDLLKNGDGMTTRRVSNEFKFEGKDISSETVRIIARGQGLKVFKLKKKPKLTQSQANRRKKFAIAFKDTDFKTWVFSDEKKFTTHTPPNKQTNPKWKHDSSEVEAIETKNWGVSQMIWAGFSYNWKTAVYFADGTMDAKTYIDCIKTTLKPAAVGRRRWTFQQDGAPIHRAKTTQAWLSKNVPNFITKEEWPANSPDLNPIENAWALMANSVARNKPTNREQLRQAILDAWEEVMTPVYMQSLIDSMPRRLEAVRKVHGYYTKY